MKCPYPPRGWYCKYGYAHAGPCPAVPRWWNIRWRFRSGSRV